MNLVLFFYYKLPLKKGQNVMQLPTWFVIVIGLSIVFIGLVSLIAICYLMGAICKALIKDEPQKETVKAPAANVSIQGKQELIAAISAAVAEELGENVSAIRITSIRRI